jgi:hypothetical protein
MAAVPASLADVTSWRAVRKIRSRWSRGSLAELWGRTTGDDPEPFIRDLSDGVGDWGGGLISDAFGSYDRT